MKRRVGSILRLGALALTPLLGAGCPLPPLLAERGDAPPTADGLHRVPARGVGAAYVKPGVRFSAYDAVVIDPVTVSYKSWPRRPRATDLARGNYALDRASMDRLKRIFQRAFEQELERSQAFVVADEPGPGTLRVSAHIVDLVWEVPPARGGESSFVLRTGEMTLILDVRDSQSGEPLARVADRQAIRPYGAGLVGGYKNNPVNNWSAVGDVASHSAGILREALDALRELPYLPHAPGAH